MNSKNPGEGLGIVIKLLKRFMKELFIVGIFMLLIGVMLVSMLHQ